MKARKVLALSLATLTAASMILTGCGGSSSDNSTIKVAIPIPLTGESAKAGAEIQEAYELAFKQIDNKIGDYTVELDFVDATSDADKGALALEEAIVKDGCIVAASSWNSSVAVAMTDVVNKYSIPWFCSSSSSSVIDEKVASVVDGGGDAYLINKIWPTSESLAIGYFELLKGMIEAGTWDAADVDYAVFCDDTDFGRVFGSTAKADMEEFGGNCVFEDYTAINVTDFYTAITKIKESGAKIAFVQLTNPAGAAAFEKQATESNLNCLRTNDCFTEASNWYELAGESANGTLVCRSKLVNEYGLQFEKDFEEEYGYTPAATTGGINYDGAKILIKVIEGTIDKYGEVTSETLYKYGTEVVQTGEFVYDESVLVSSYQYEEGNINPIVDQDHFYFQVTQLESGEEVVVWPDQDKEADIIVPEV